LSLAQGDRQAAAHRAVVAQQTKDNTALRSRLAQARHDLQVTQTALREKDRALSEACAALALARDEAARQGHQARRLEAENAQLRVHGRLGLQAPHSALHQAAALADAAAGAAAAAVPAPAVTEAAGDVAEDGAELTPPPPLSPSRGPTGAFAAGVAGLAPAVLDRNLARHRKFTVDQARTTALFPLTALCIVVTSRLLLHPIRSPPIPDAAGLWLRLHLHMFASACRCCRCRRRWTTCARSCTRPAPPTPPSAPPSSR